MTHNDHKVILAVLYRWIATACVVIVSVLASYCLTILRYEGFVLLNGAACLGVFGLYRLGGRRVQVELVLASLCWLALMSVAIIAIVSNY